MANILGQNIIGHVQIIMVDSDPSAGSGTPSPIGSLALQSNGDVWSKIGAANADWTMLQAFGVIESQNRYVDYDNGSDVTGNGSQTNPWATLGYAYSQLDPVGTGIDYQIFISGSGTVGDGTVINAKPKIDLVGPSYISLTILNPITWVIPAGVTSHVAVENLALGGNINFDGTLAAFSVFLLNQVNTTAGLTVKNPVFPSASLLLDCILNGAVEITGGAIVQGCQVFGSTLTIKEGSLTFIGNTLMTIAAGMTIEGNSTTYLYGSAYSPTFTAVNVTGDPTIISDSASIPPNIVGMAVLTLLSNGNRTAYSPAAPANWVAPPPDNVQDALDRIANVVSAGGGTPIP